MRPWLSLMIVLGACTAGADSSVSQGGDFSVTVEQSEAMDTVATVRWTTEAAGTSWIEFGEDESYGQRTKVSTTTSTEHAVLLAGLPVASTVHWRAASEVDGTVLYSGDQTLKTSPAPSSAPSFTLSADTTAQSDLIVLPVLASHSYVLVLDRRGRVVWYTDYDYLDHSFPKATLSRDGRSILYSSYNSDRTIDDSKIIRMSLDQSTIEEILTPGGHHDFVELPDGNLAYLKLEVRQVEGQDVVGDSIVELDASGGFVREIWNAWDAIPEDLYLDDDSGFYPQGIDWLHGNSLNYLEDRDSFLYSSRSLSTAYEIDHTTGAVLNSIGAWGDWTLTSGTSFEQQHQPKLSPTGTLLVFDNTTSEDFSAAREYELDEAAKSYHEIWSHRSVSGNWCFLMGDVHRYDDGNTLVSFGTVGYLTEVDGDGDEAWRLDAEVGSILGFIHSLDGLGGPL